ncbi:5321_t:CDS:2, partial [Gigaspora margarita]
MVIKALTHGTTNICKKFLVLALEIDNINIVDDNNDINNNLINIVNDNDNVNNNLINIVDDNDDVNNNLIQSFEELSDDTLSGDDDDNFNSCRIWGSKRAISCSTKIGKVRTVIQDFKTIGKSKKVILILGKSKQEIITIDLDIYLLIVPYSKIIFALQEHHVEEDFQRAKHLIEILK